MSMNHHLPKKISLVPKKHHGFQFFLFLCGLLLPPIAVAVRFGIGKDFFINVFLCILGYFPCHFHNFYIQNIRNNQNRARTPKWAIKHGLVDNSDRERRARKNQWSKRFDERNAHSTLRDQELEAGEEGANYDPSIRENPEEMERRRNEGLWTGDDEEYYNADQAPNQRNWHYPANFEGTVGDGRSYKRGKSGSSGDRWERASARRSSNASSSGYPPAAATDNDVPEWGKDYGSKRRSSKNKKSNKKVDWINDSPNDYGNNNDSWRNNGSQSSLSNGNGYGGGRANGRPAGSGAGAGGNRGDPNWDHEF